MRITIHLPDELIVQIKKLVAASNSTVTALIEDALREALARRRRTGRREKVILKTYGKQGPSPGSRSRRNDFMLGLMGSYGDLPGR